MTTKKTVAVEPTERLAPRVEIVENSPFSFIAAALSLGKAGYRHDHNEVFALTHGLCLATFVLDEQVTA